MHLFYCQSNVTSFVLGAEDGPLVATTAKDFDNKLQGVPAKAAPCQATSIAVSELRCVFSYYSARLVSFLIIYITRF